MLSQCQSLFMDVIHISMYIRISMCFIFCVFLLNYINRLIMDNCSFYLQHLIYCKLLWVNPGSGIIKIYFVLNSFEHELTTAQKIILKNNNI